MFTGIRVHPDQTCRVLGFEILAATPSELLSNPRRSSTACLYQSTQEGR